MTEALDNPVWYVIDVSASGVSSVHYAIEVLSQPTALPRDVPLKATGIAGGVVCCDDVVQLALDLDGLVRVVAQQTHSGGTRSDVDAWAGRFRSPRSLESRILDFVAGPKVNRPPTTQYSQGHREIGIQRIIRYMHESNDVTREVLHQRPSIFRRVQKFLFGPYQPGERADGASPLSLTATDYCSTRLAHLTVDLSEVPLKSFDPLCRSERAGVRAGAYDVRRVWGGRATWIPTFYDHALGKVDPLGKLKFGAS